MKNKYVILFDVDGTLVETGKTNVSENVIESLKYAKEKGNILVICTGRSLQSSKKVNCIDIFNYLACLMGSVIYNNEEQKIIYESDNKINGEYVRPLIEYFIETKKLWTYKDECQDKTTYINERGNSIFNAKIVNVNEVIKDIDIGIPIFQLLADESIINEDIIKKYDNLEFIKMPENYYDILKKGLSKANAVKYFKKQFPDYKIVAIGDSNNDIPMLENADISIVMGNANDDVKKSAKFITKSVLEDGVSFAINEILKI